MADDHRVGRRWSGSISRIDLKALREKAMLDGVRAVFSRVRTAREHHYPPAWSCQGRFHPGILPRSRVARSGHQVHAFAIRCAAVVTFHLEGGRGSVRAAAPRRGRDRPRYGGELAKASLRCAEATGRSFEGLLWHENAWSGGFASSERDRPGRPSAGGAGSATGRRCRVASSLREQGHLDPVGRCPKAAITNCLERKAGPFLMVQCCRNLSGRYGDSGP